MLKNLKGSPLSVFFGTVRFFSRKWKKIFFFNFFMFCDRMDVEKPQRVPPFSFSALWDFSAPGARASEPRRATRSIFLVCNFFKKNFFEKFSIFEYCKRILDTWKSFCYFWALDMAPTWAGPGLLFILSVLQPTNYVKCETFLWNFIWVVIWQKLKKTMKFQ